MNKLKAYKAKKMRCSPSVMLQTLWHVLGDRVPVYIVPRFVSKSRVVSDW